MLSTGFGLNFRKCALYSYPFQTEPFQDIVERLAAVLHVGSSHILLTHKTQTIQPHDTPSLLGIDTTDFIGECIAASVGSFITDTTGTQLAVCP